MPVRVSYIEPEERLDLSFQGTLDLTASQDVCDVCKRLPAALKSCIIDLTGVERLFDSGVALLKTLHRRLMDAGAIVVILSDHPVIHQWFPVTARRPLQPPPEPHLRLYSRSPAANAHPA